MIPMWHTSPVEDRYRILFAWAFAINFGLLMVILCLSSSPASAEFIDQLGSSGTSAGSPAGVRNLFKQGDEQPIEIDLRQLQDALYDPKIKKPEDQTAKGVLVVDHEPYKPVQIKIRNLAQTFIYFPEDEVIDDVLLGDGSIFNVDFPRVEGSSAPTRKNVLVASLNEGQVGGDTNMTAIGRLREDGTRRTYLFILSGWSYNSDTISDFFVFIRDRETGTGKVLPEEAKTSVRRLASLNGNNVEKTPEYLREIPFDPMMISVDDYLPMRPENAPEAEAARVMPRQIWNDGYWTYLEYDEIKADTMRWFAIRKVVDGVNSPVDWHRHPNKHNVIVVHSVGQNLYLRNGENRVLCLIWLDDEAKKEVRRSAVISPAIAPSISPAPEAELAPVIPAENTEDGLIPEDTVPTMTGGG
jgi:type IV secretory pathway VirB9-like protein